MKLPEEKNSNVDAAEGVNTVKSPATRQCPCCGICILDEVTRCPHCRREIGWGVSKVTYTRPVNEPVD